MQALMVHVLLSHEEGHVLSHCLEFDLVAQGGTIIEAFRNLLDAIDLEVSYAQETGDLEQLIQPAPAEYWRLLVSAERCTPQPNGWALPTILSDVECRVVRGS